MSAGASVLVVLMLSVILLGCGRQKVATSVATGPQTVFIPPAAVAHPGLAAPVETNIDQGLSLEVKDAYAYALHTSVDVVIQSKGTPIEFPVIDKADLTANNTSMGNSGSGNEYNGINELLFIPLLPEQLLHPVQLTLTVHHISAVMTGKPYPPGEKEGNWHATFTVQPVAAPLYQFHAAPVVVADHMQVTAQSLEMVPAPDLYENGVRLILLVQNVPPATTIDSFGRGWVPSTFHFDPNRCNLYIRPCPPPQASVALTLSGQPVNSQFIGTLPLLPTAPGGTLSTPT